MIDKILKLKGLNDIGVNFHKDYSEEKIIGATICLNHVPLQESILVTFSAATKDNIESIYLDITQLKKIYKKAYIMGYTAGEDRERNKNNKLIYFPTKIDQFK